MTVQEKLYTADDLWEISHSVDDDQRFELDEGALVEMSPTGDTHGIIAPWLLHLIMIFLDTHDLGNITAAETGYVLFSNPYTVRAPDIGFIAKARVKPLTGKYYQMAPDFAVEVVSPNDTATEIHRKVRQFLRAGTRLVWVVYPDDRTIDVYRPGHGSETYEQDGVLDGGDVLPGLALAISDVFKKLDD